MASERWRFLSLTLRVQNKPGNKCEQCLLPFVASTIEWKAFSSYLRSCLPLPRVRLLISGKEGQQHCKCNGDQLLPNWILSKEDIHHLLLVSLICSESQLLKKKSHNKGRGLLHCLEWGSHGLWAVSLALERSVVRTKQPRVYGQVGGLLSFVIQQKLMEL